MCDDGVWACDREKLGAALRERLEADRRHAGWSRRAARGASDSEAEGPHLAPPFRGGATQVPTSPSTKVGE